MAKNKDYAQDMQKEGANMKIKLKRKTQYIYSERGRKICYTY